MFVLGCKFYTCNLKCVFANIIRVIQKEYVCVFANLVCIYKLYTCNLKSVCVCVCQFCICHPKCVCVCVCVCVCMYVCVCQFCICHPKCVYVCVIVVTLWMSSWLDTVPSSQCLSRTTKSIGQKHLVDWPPSFLLIQEALPLKYRLISSHKWTLTLFRYATLFLLFKIIVILISVHCSKSQGEKERSAW